MTKTDNKTSAAGGSPEANATPPVPPATAPTHGNGAPNATLTKAEEFAASCSTEGCSEASWPAADERRKEAWKHGHCPKHFGPKKTADEWAKAKGMLHEFSEGKRGSRARPKAPAPLIHNPKHVHYHRARRSNGWAANEELTEAEFEIAVQTADSHVYR